MGWSLSRADEFFTHQVPCPHAMVGSSDPNWRERYWISLHDVKRQDFILSAGFGKYPNQDVFEACAMAQTGNQQRNLRLSRQLRPDVDSMRVGPMAVEVLEPLQALRFSIAPNPSGIEGDFTWRAALPAMLEGRHFEIQRSRVSHDLARYVQLGRVEGTLAIGPRTFRLDPETTWAERDHSWGLRPMAPFPGEPPAAPAEWNFLAFCPLQFPGFAVHFYLFEAQAGRPTHLSASLVRSNGSEGEDDEIEAVEHEFRWFDGAPVITLEGGTIVLRLYSGKTVEIALRALAPRVYLRGGGYGVDHGRWKGESHLEHDTWDLSDSQKLPVWAASSSDHLVEARCGDQVGYGIIEYMVRRAHAKYAPALPPSRRRG